MADQPATRHEFTCPYDECPGELEHLRRDAAALRLAAGDVLTTSGFRDRLTHSDLASLRRAVRDYDHSPAT